ncbi:MAG: PQQ-dependent sugar dehydrogenase [Fibrobacteres bacterium]|jgi:cytochrome c|nr:PQQ-dependent sugar dehydrogenase [Fibrobacterota bacterium]
MSKSFLPPAFFLSILLIAFAPVRAAFTTPACSDWKPGEFRYAKLISQGTTDSTLNEPLKLATALRGDGKVDVYFIERHGKVKRWNPDDSTVSTLLSLNTWTDSPDKVDSTGPDAETGMEAIALDPGFGKNHRIFLRYEPWDKPVYRISRFEVDGDSIPMASEKVILEIPYVREHTHLQAIVLGGAGMAFDPDGNLLINVGANTELSPSVNEKYRDFSAEYTSSYLRNLRGAILRIHPDDSPKGYTIPKGNFAEYYSDWFKQKGQDSLAGVYADTSMVKPEIYIKGVRNPYSITVDPVRGWVTWGEFGPNRMGMTRVEEDNVAMHPVYGGYPYWAGKNEFLLEGMHPWVDNNPDPKAPMNNSVWNDGPKTLPPADTPRYAYSNLLNYGFLVGNHPTVGPFYHYDPESPSTIKFPPHFDKAWFLAERATKSLRVLQLDETGSYVIDSVMVSADQQLSRPLDVEQGADGAIYVVDYGDGWHSTSPNTQIGRFEYTGSCHPGASEAIRRLPGRQPDIRLGARSLEIREAGSHVVREKDLKGREIGIWRGTGPQTYSLGRPGQGVSIITITFPESGKIVTGITVSP